MPPQTQLAPSVAQIVVDHLSPVKPRKELERKLQSHLAIGNPPRLDPPEGSQYLAALRFYDSQVEPKGTRG